MGQQGKTSKRTAPVPSHQSRGRIEATQAAPQRWPFRHLIVAVLLIALLVAFRVSMSSGASSYIEDFSQSTGLEVGPKHDFFGAGLDGDGATVAIVALDPLGSHVGHLLFEPTYRYTRLGYPLLSLVVSAAQPSLILLAISLIGFLAIGVLAYLASALRDHFGWRSWFLIANPALMVGVFGDTTEPLAAMMLALALLTGARVFAVGTALTRPSFVVALANRFRMFAVGALSVVVTRLIWTMRFDTSFFQGTRNFDWPFLGFLGTPSWPGWLVVLAAGWTLTVGLVKRDAGWIVGGLLVLVLADVVFYTPTNAIRAAGYLPVLWAFGPNWDRRLLPSHSGVRWVRSGST